jgi:hypothetical protein
MNVKYIGLLVGIAFSFPALSQDSSALDDRENVMECSFDEVTAYMSLPDPERKVMSDYDSWTAGYMSTEMARASTDPRVCLSVLYGDLSAMAEEIKSATQGLMSMQLPGIDEILSQLGDKLLESICSRAASARDEVAERIITETDTLRADAERELMEKYSMEAMEDLALEAVVPPEFAEEGIKYRNGKVETYSFQSKVKSRWSDELDELRDDVVGN